MCTSVTFCIQQNHDLPSQTKLGSIHVSFIFYYLCTFPTSLAWIIRAYHVYCYFLVPPKYFAFTKPIPKHLVLLTPGAHTVCCTGLFHFFFQCLIYLVSCVNHNILKFYWKGKNMPFVLPLCYTHTHTHITRKLTHSLTVFILSPLWGYFQCSNVNTQQLQYWIINCCMSYPYTVSV
jgi:hypothetical protein